MCSTDAGWRNEDILNFSHEEFINCTTETTPTGPLTRPVFYYTPEPNSIQSSIRWGFLLHAYGFAGLFFFLAFYAFFSILNLRSQLSTRPYMSTINSFLCILGVSRAGILFIDPYGLKKTLPALLGTLVWDLGFPCLISSFSLIQIAFLQLTQLETGPEKYRKKTILSVVSVCHFVAVIATAIYSNLNTDLVIVRFGFQLGFSLWGFFLCTSFLYAGKRVLGILGYSNTAEGTGGPPNHINEKGVAGLMAGMMGQGQGQNLASSLTAALAPTLLQSTTQAPKIKITDENDHTVSVASDSSKLNENIQENPVVKPTSSSSKTTSVRPPSPVLPRKKSGGNATALRTPSSTSSSTCGGVRKKSLTWSEADGNTNISTTKEEPKSESASLLVSANEKRRGSRKSMDLTEDRSTGGGTTITESLLISSGGSGPDFTLQSILSHIAYVNQTALDYRLSRKLSRKNQVHKVIKYTSITACLGVLLCIGEIIRIVSPYGLLVTSTSPPAPWPWFILENFCRCVEFIMSAVIANISKQPVNRPHHYAAYSYRHKHQRDSLYL